ncbi:MAG: sigma 54-interacting transcriptional regulator [Pyrinomonadaceae bacterium]
MPITLTGNDDPLVGNIRDRLAEESGLDVLHVGLADLLEGRSNVANAELLFLLTKELEPDNVAEWVFRINPTKGRVRRLILCMPRPNARDTGLLLKHADEIIVPAGFEVEHFVERVLGQLIPERPIETHGYGELLGATKRMRDVYRDIEKYAKLKEPVLILGETGTGKELVARAIHAASTRRSQAFVACNCTTVPKEIAESHLFGHRRGAFTGAVTGSLGVVRTAEGGTLFLDEVGDLPPEIQPKLLRLLQEKEIQPVGEQKPEKVDVRFVFATSCKLREDVEQDTFRRDLYARLNRIVLELPPLRERKADIPLLVEHFKKKFNNLNGTTVEVQPAAIDELFCIDWQENVRDLDNVVARAAANAGPDGVITETLMRESMRRAGGFGNASKQAAAAGLFRTVVFQPREDDWWTVQDRAEATYLRAVLEVAKGEKEALKLSGIGRAQFFVKLKKHGLSLKQ